MLQKRKRGRPRRNSGENESKIEPKSDFITSPIPKLYTVPEVAEMFGISKQTMYGWVHHKRIPYTKIGKQVRFTPENLNAFVKAGNRHAAFEA
jgi:excisionase family DNA binding protein